MPAPRNLWEAAGRTLTTASEKVPAYMINQANQKGDDEQRQFLNDLALSRNDLAGQRFDFTKEQAGLTNDFRKQQLLDNKYDRHMTQLYRMAMAQNTADAKLAEASGAGAGGAGGSSGLTFPQERQAQETFNKNEVTRLSNSIYGSLQRTNPDYYSEKVTPSKNPADMRSVISNQEFAREEDIEGSSPWYWPDDTRLVPDPMLIAQADSVAQFQQGGYPNLGPFPETIHGLGRTGMQAPQGSAAVPVQGAAPVQNNQAGDEILLQIQKELIAEHGLEQWESAPQEVRDAAIARKRQERGNQ